SARTVSRRLQELRLRSRIRCRGSILNAERCHRRLQWTRLHQRWTLQRWRSVLFTGKGRICLVMSDRRTVPDSCIQEQDGWGGASIMVCGGISYNSKTPIIVIEWNWTTRRTKQRFFNQLSSPSFKGTLKFCASSKTMHALTVLG
ncbi:hypothetical protein CAPTEDRAFT_104931, partial [Capitella teleta]